MDGPWALNPSRVYSRLNEEGGFPTPPKRGSSRSGAVKQDTMDGILLYYGYIDCCRPLFTIFNFEGNPRTLGQGLKAGAVNIGMMNKNIGPTLLLDEPITFLVTEPFYNTLRHVGNLLSIDFFWVNAGHNRLVVVRSCSFFLIHIFILFRPGYVCQVLYFNAIGNFFRNPAGPAPRPALRFCSA